MTDHRPVWFLDVDGVLNALARVPLADGIYTRANAADQTGRIYPLRYSPAIVERITDLHEAGAVRIVWLTTWGESARTGVAPALGLPDFEAETDRDSFWNALGEDHHVFSPWPRSADWASHTWWKRHLATQWLLAHPGISVIWTDDDLTEHETAALRADFPDLPMLALRPAGNRGLTPGHLDQIAAFAAR